MSGQHVFKNGRKKIIILGAAAAVLAASGIAAASVTLSTGRSADTATSDVESAAFQNATRSQTRASGESATLRSDVKKSDGAKEKEDGDDDAQKDKGLHKGLHKGHDKGKGHAKHDHKGLHRHGDGEKNDGKSGSAKSSTSSKDAKSSSSSSSSGSSSSKSSGSSSSSSTSGLNVTQTKSGLASYFGDSSEYQPLACGGNSRTTTKGVALWVVPCGTLVRITSKATGKTVTAPVADRGPASWTGVAIDLLPDTWDALGVSRGQGKQQVTYEVLGKNSSGSSASGSSSSSKASGSSSSSSKSSGTSSSSSKSSSSSSSKSSGSSSSGTSSTNTSGRKVVQTKSGSASYFGDSSEYQPLACGGNSRTTTKGVALWVVPCGTLVRITSKATGKTVTAPVADRGPASWTGVAIDLLPDTWDALGVSRGQGKQQVTYEVLGK